MQIVRVRVFVCVCGGGEGGGSDAMVVRGVMVVTQVTLSTKSAILDDLYIYIYIYIYIYK
jgi:hypothetical protein